MLQSIRTCPSYGLHIQPDQLAQRVVDRIPGISDALVPHAALTVILSVFQRHVAVIRNRVVFRAVMRLVNAGIEAFRAAAGEPVSLRGVCL